MKCQGRFCVCIQLLNGKNAVQGCFFFFRRKQAEIACCPESERNLKEIDDGENVGQPDGVLVEMTK